MPWTFHLYSLIHSTSIHCVPTMCQALFEEIEYIPVNTVSALKEFTVWWEDTDNKQVIK